MSVPLHFHFSSSDPPSLHLPSLFYLISLFFLSCLFDSPLSPLSCLSVCLSVPKNDPYEGEDVGYEGGSERSDGQSDLNNIVASSNESAADEGGSESSYAFSGSDDEGSEVSESSADEHGSGGGESSSAFRLTCWFE